MFFTCFSTIGVCPDSVPGGLYFNLCLLSVSVPQVLAMMVELEEDEDWAFQDEVEDEDHDR